MTFLASPNLPDSQVALAAIDEAQTAVICALERYGVDCIGVSPNLRLDAPVRSHADMLIHHLGGRDVLVESVGAGHARRLSAHGFEVLTIEKPLERNYPHDAALNAARVGRHLVCGKHVAPEIALYCRQNEIAPVYCAQGYARCAVCIVGENALITADPSIAQVCEGAGMDVLRIRAGHIRLEGYPYGFIGGCCGLLDSGLLAFTGDVLRHPDGKAMVDFMGGHGVKYIDLTGGELVDIGGILPLGCK
ncbi:MAG: DUF6873 family GME fold protein [Acetanaerobacterium sp.]